MVSPSTRATIASTLGTGKRYFKTTSKLVGNVAWVVTTSALLVGLPLALAIEGEGMLVQQEKMMQGNADAGAQQVRKLFSFSPPRPYLKSALPVPPVALWRTAATSTRTAAGGYRAAGILRLGRLPLVICIPATPTATKYSVVVRLYTNSVAISIACSMFPRSGLVSYKFARQLYIFPQFRSVNCARSSSRGENLLSNSLQERKSHVGGGKTSRESRGARTF
jgi:hypothetical protein